MSDFCPTPDIPSKLFFSRRNTAKIGRFTIPFPFSAILGLLMIPVLFIGVAISIPVNLVGRSRNRRREAGFAMEMRAVGRWISWNEASTQAEKGGTFIVESLSCKGPSRWFTSEDVSKTSPYPCCLEDWPWAFENGTDFFEWCRARFTDPVFGSASIVGPNETERDQIPRLLVEFRTQRRVVSIAHAHSPTLVTEA
jgi:hypothetical protein